MIKRTLCALALALLPAHAAVAGIITAMEYADDSAFSAATGAMSLTGPLPELGDAGNSVAIGHATLSAGNTIFVGKGWSDLLPNERAIAISGRENLDVSIDTGVSTAFGFYFHEPTRSTDKLNGCNATCFDSTFVIDFRLGGALVDSMQFQPANDRAIFEGIILDTAFDEVAFTEIVGGIDNEFFGEMFVARAVPLPGTLSLIALGLLGLAPVCRRGGTVAPAARG